MDKEYTDLGSSTDYLTWLEHAVEDRDEAERRIAKCVRGARAQGASWAAIGRQLGVSKQAAQKKYGNVACSCGCGGTDADCTTPVPEGPARDLTPAEEEREALGEWAFTAEEEAKGRAALATLQAIAASQDAAAAADAYGTTPVDLAVPKLTISDSMHQPVNMEQPVENRPNKCENKYCGLREHYREEATMLPGKFLFFNNCTPTQSDQKRYNAATADRKASFGK